MEARMKTIAAGPDINVGLGQIVRGDRAQEFAAAGYADEVAAALAAPETASAPDAAAPVEQAVAPAAESAVAPAGRKAARKR